MIDWGSGYEKPEYIRISEQIHKKKDEKKKLELALSEAKLQYRYIATRKSVMQHKALLQLVLIVMIYLIAMACMGNVFAIFLGFLLLLFDLYLIFKEIKIVMLLIFSLNTEITVRYADRHDIKTFSREERRVSSGIKTLQLQITKLGDEITDLEQQKKESIEKEREAATREQEALPDEKADKAKTGGFTLKESSVSYVDTKELYEYFLRDENYEKEYLTKLDGQLQYIEKEISNLQEDFESARKKILLFVILFVVVAVIQGSFEGVLASVTNIICFTASICGILYLYKTCKQPIIMYLIEQENNLTKEYAFIHNLVPIKTKRADLLEEKERCEKEIAQIKKKRAELSFD